MNYKQLVEMINDGRRPFVEFTEKIEEYDGYFDACMRAKITNAVFDDDGETVRINFNFEQFTTHNDAMEKNNYWDGNGNPTLTAKQANMYPKTFIDTFWFDACDEVGDYFTFFASKNEVYEKYQKERKDGQSYTQWMEETIKSFYDKT